MPNIALMSLNNTNTTNEHQQQPQITVNYPLISHNPLAGCTYLNDANKAFDDVVFELLKVDPDDIAGQLTLIDLPLFKAIEPDELISCKWISREKLVKAPNIVQFTRRFNQTTFWCQKEILNCKRLETRAKMLTHFIKICKRLNELHSFNSLMAIIVALKSAPIYRLKKTWSHISKRDQSTFDRLADLMFDTSDNKRKIRDTHMNTKLPCIPFLGLFLTDLIHIDIAHPHNSFDNPQRRNQMNNICRLISEYQQSNYQDLSSIDTCTCEFPAACSNSTSHLDCLNTNTDNSLCLVTNCSCALHHGNGYGGGLINNDGTIYINEIKYVKNYLNSFLYIEELQKFKEDENYRDSLELEPEPELGSPMSTALHFSNSSPSKLVHTVDLTSSSSSSSSTTSQTTKPVNNNNNNNNNQANLAHHRKTLSISNNLLNETKDLLQQLKHHPLDDSLVVDSNNITNNTTTNTTTITTTTNTNNTTTIQLPQIHQAVPCVDSANNSLILTELASLNLNLSKEEQKRLLNSVKLTDPPSLLKELLKHRHNSQQQHSNSLNQSQKSLKNKFSCYSSSTADLDDDENEEEEEEDESDFDPTDSNNNNQNADNKSTPIRSSSSSDKLNSTLVISSCSSSDRRLSGRNLAKSLNDEKDQMDHSSETSYSSSILSNLQQLIQFESPIKRKCIIKNFRKPRFSQWKSYWLQLVGGNLLIYYPAKTSIMFSSSQANSRRPSSVDADLQGFDQVDAMCLSHTEQLKNQVQGRKVYYHKNPSKMHPIASWMVVNLFQDRENEILASSNSELSTSNKFDVQLNDLNNGNMYKYRFDSLELAKEWLEQFKLASTYHERQKPDNLIRFD